MSHIVNTLIDEFQKDVEEGAYDDVECKECRCTSTTKQVAEGEMQHWNNCSHLASDADFSGASDTPGFANDR